MQQAGIGPDAVALLVMPVEDGAAPRIAHRSEAVMNPASVMKLLTSFAAFERLGPAHVWTTRLGWRGRVDAKGVLQGDLYLIGGGDPAFSDARLWKLLRQVRQAGIQRVQGDIVLDDGALALPAHDPAAFDGRPLRPYNAGPGGLVINFNSIRITFLPDGERIRLLADPPLSGLRFDNRLQLEAGPCERWDRALDAALQGDTLVISGSYRLSCGRRDWQVAPLPPARYNAALVDALWHELGGRLDGTVRTGRAPADLRPQFEEVSEPLADIVQDMNTWSNNLQARQLLASLGAASAEDAVAEGARQARLTLQSAGLDVSSLVLDNGAGLSRHERASARLLGELLRRVWQRPWMADFVAGLPTVGIDGTARRWLSESPARGQAQLKTGTLDGVRAVAGYVLDRHGRRQIVVLLINHPAASGRAAQDALIEWIWRAE